MFQIYHSKINLKISTLSIYIDISHNQTELKDPNINKKSIKTPIINLVLTT